MNPYSVQLSYKDFNIQKPILKLSENGFKFLKQCKIGFFVDTSYHANSSVNINGNIQTLFNFEVLIVHVMCKYLEHNEYYFISWNDYITIVPSYLELRVSDRIANIPRIFKNIHSYEIIKKIEVAIIITPGKLCENETIEFCHYVVSKVQDLKSIIFLIVGKNYEKELFESFERILKITSSMLSNCTVVYCIPNFQNGNFVEIGDAKNHYQVQTYIHQMTLEDIMYLKIPTYNEINSLHGYTSLGHGIYIDPQFLLQYQFNAYELLTSPLNEICRYFCSGERCLDFLQWIQKEKHFIQLHECDNMGIKALDTMAYNKQEALICLDIIEKRVYNYICINPRSVLLYSLNILLPRIQKKNKSFVGDDMLYLDHTIKCIDFDPYEHYFMYPNVWYYNFIRSNFDQSSEIPLMSCSICFETKIEPFILIRKKLTKDLPVLLKNVILNKEHNRELLSYFYKEILCARCANILIHESGKDPQRQTVIAALPLVKFGSNLFSKFYYLYCFSEIVELDFVMNTSTNNDYINIIKEIVQKVLTLFESF
ncbi:MAG: hypothetical protein QW303_09285, partial [Nitrososphaerota archaeon]